MLRIGLCDDVYDVRIELEAKLERILEKRAIEYNIFSFSSGEGLLKWMNNHTGELDLVFLDIEMHEIDGMKTAQILRQADEHLQMVFVTGYSEKVFEGYGVGALGYLMKPPQNEQLDDIITRAITALHRDSDKMFICKSGESTHRLPTSSILYFYSEKRKVYCVTNEQTYDFYSRLDKVEEELGGEFVRIHQRYLVRAQSVDKIENSSVIIDGENLPMSRGYQHDAMLLLTRASLGDLNA